ncbi:MAG: hypothetical protein PVJ70_14565, partial [Syntrophobacterales bacterium]
MPDREPRFSAGQASDRANREPTRRVGLQAKRGEKNSALRAGSLHTATVGSGVINKSASAEGRGTFPWPSSP